MLKQTLIYRVKTPIPEGDLTDLFAGYGTVYELKLQLNIEAGEQIGWGYVILDEGGARRAMAKLGQAGEARRFAQEKAAKVDKVKRPVEIWLPCSTCLYNDFCVNVIRDDVYDFSCSSYCASKRMEQKHR